MRVIGVKDGDFMSDGEREQIIYKTKPSRLNFSGKYFGGILCIILAVFLWIDYFSIASSLPIIYGFNLLFWLVIGFIVVAFLLVLKAEIDRHKISYEISKHRVFKIVGILRKKQTTIPFQKLERTDVSQSILDRLVNIGTVRVDTGEDHFLLEGVPDPEEIDRIIFEEGIKKQSRW